LILKVIISNTKIRLHVYDQVSAARKKYNKTLVKYYIINYNSIRSDINKSINVVRRENFMLNSILRKRIDEVWKETNGSSEFGQFIFELLRDARYSDPTSMLIEKILDYCTSRDYK